MSAEIKNVPGYEWIVVDADLPEILKFASEQVEKFGPDAAA